MLPVAPRALREVSEVAVAITRAQPFNFPPWCRIGTTLVWKFVDPVYPRLFSAYSDRADLCRRLGRIPEARASYEKALALTQQEPEQQFLQELIRQLR
jgi:hypothetical protein